MHQAVVAPPAADPRLRTKPVMDELEGGLGVVVQAAHHARVDDIGHSKRVQMGEHGVEMLLGDIRQMIQQHRRRRRHRTQFGSLVVEHPQRIDPCAPASVLVEIESKQELLQQFPVLRTATLVSQGGDFQPEPVETQRAEPGVGNGDHLGVQRRVVDADRLHPDLL
ncbi:Uncharacterised protein [Mycobacterium tuberculosis]|uniref:Uncharacterized protein n=1 Tax=Mycobacterium tuberculosis TaxID=1773 RepID=A0A916L7S6_MYCTX|nr:Uncharacterised protein [Mycobacterium tuberculosis]